MIRLLIAWVGLPILPAFVALLSWVSPGVHIAWAPSRPAVWEIQARQSEMDALKARIETLQARVDGTNRKLAGVMAALESEPR